MADDIMNAEPELGMNELVAAWRDRRGRHSMAADAPAQGHQLSRSVMIPWESRGAEGLPELLIPAAIVVAGDHVAEGQLIEAVTWPWFEILKELARDANFLHHLDWRRIEELIAGAYKRNGWSEVILTPRSGDGGRDIIATRPNWGTIRFYDQVKKYGPGHKVPANDVRALLGVLTLHQNVSKAVITTTALFAPGVYDEFKPAMPHRLELRDGPRLREWLLGRGSSPK